MYFKNLYIDIYIWLELTYQFSWKINVDFVLYDFLFLGKLDGIFGTEPDRYHNMRLLPIVIFIWTIPIEHSFKVIGGQKDN